MKTVLIVDDDPILQVALTRRLKAQGFGVVNAASGVEALNLLDTTRADVVVSDILMPEMDGFELCRQVRASPRDQLLPFIFLSSLGTVSDRVQGHLIGADDYLVKPFHPQELMAKVQAAIARSERLQAALAEVSVPGPRRPSASAPLPLTPAEIAVFWPVVQGLTNRQIGDHLCLSPRTVQTHISHILTKLGLENRAQLVRYAYEQGYKPPDP
ncbi:MAG TPA: response regulator transcription factor [Leptolyngbyaceae cyanobacterium M65_K2018_010]|nr:response regulator transcription factor [Leptolyngbyaceae cyanobacterium M65_K2018_010]